MRRQITPWQALALGFVALLMIPINIVLLVGFIITSACSDISGANWCLKNLDDLWFRAQRLVLP